MRKKEDLLRQAAYWLRKAEESLKSVENTPHGDDSRDAVDMAKTAGNIAETYIKLADLSGSEDPDMLSAKLARPLYSVRPVCVIPECWCDGWAHGSWTR